MDLSDLKARGSESVGECTNNSRLGRGSSQTLGHPRAAESFLVRLELPTSVNIRQMNWLLCGQQPRQRVTRPVPREKPCQSSTVGHRWPRAEWIEVPVQARVSERDVRPDARAVGRTNVIHLGALSSRPWCKASYPGTRTAATACTGFWKIRGLSKPKSIAAARPHKGGTVAQARRGVADSSQLRQRIPPLQNK